MFNCINCGKENPVKRNCLSKYCDNKCQQEFQYRKYIEEWKAGIKDGKKGKLQCSGHIHRYVLRKQDGKCKICGISEYNGMPLTLELDHIDGDSDNNVEDNLGCLCPNCHSQTPTYRAKNKGNGRKLR